MALETKPMKVKVLKVGTIRTFGQDGKAQVFSAEINGQQVAAETSRPKLFEYIKEGAELDADVAERKWTGNDQLEHVTYQIADIRIGGQSQAGGKFSGGRSYGKSPEEQEQIRRQVALKAAVEIATAEIAAQNAIPATAMILKLADEFVAWLNKIVVAAPAPKDNGQTAEAVLFDGPSDLTPLKRFYAVAQEYMGTQDTTKVSTAFAKQHEGQTPEQVSESVLEKAIAAINSSMVTKRAMKNT